jgi:general stress protein YciG
MAEKKKEMTTSEAGRKGGERTAETHGKEFYQSIGQKGGEAEHECRGRECTHPSHQRERGGSTSESTHEKLSEAGRKGAEAQPKEAKRKGGEHSHKNE